MVEVSEASLRFVCAVESDDSADVTDASSESIWLVDALEASSLARLVLRRRQLGLGGVQLLVQRRGVDGCQDLSGRDGLPALTLTRGDGPETAKLRLA